MIKVYDTNMKLTAILENAFAVGYEERFNELWTACFNLPADDPKVAECLPFRFVEIFDGEERVDLFRIAPTKLSSGDGKTITYQCEHVLVTLIDDILFQYHQIGGTGIPTANILQYILSKQVVPRWHLGTVAFAHEFEYKWENENLLAATFSVPKPFSGSYQWAWDTESYPWTLDLMEPESGAPSCYIRYGKNLKGITKEEDPTKLCTRLYVLGYGEGTNQLTIRNVNPTGQPYIDADTQGQYGIISRIYTDRKCESVETLFAAAQAQLEQLKLPRITYSVEGAEIYRLTNEPIDRFKSGALVRVIDEELGIDVVSRVIVRGRPDVNGTPGDVRLEIANKQATIAGSIAQLADRQRVNEVYAQGATNIDSHDFADNCDPDHSAVIRFYLPAETVRINKMALSFEAGPFRSYSRGNEAKQTEVVTSTIDSQKILTSDVGTWTYNPVSWVPGDLVMDPNGDHSHTVYVSGSTSSEQDNPVDAYHSHTFSGSGSTSTDGDHVHRFYPDHDHDLTIPSHSHNVTIPAHSHEVIYGIYEGPTPSELSIKVDGNAVPGTATSGTDIDIIPYLSKDSEGRINRGAWHTIEITPNSLGRIIANVVTQLFVQSRGGGDY